MFLGCMKNRAGASTSTAFQGRFGESRSSKGFRPLAYALKESHVVSRGKVEASRVVSDRVRSGGDGSSRLVGWGLVGSGRVGSGSVSPGRV